MSKSPKTSYKQITFDNWIQQDPINKVFVCVNPDGSSRPMKAEEYLNDILSFSLNDYVPEDIQQLYEVAKGTMTYGYYYYPIFTFASEQLFRIVEAAVSQVCQALGNPKSISTYHKKIEWLLDKEIIHEEEKSRWDSIRHLRNQTSHPESQMIFPPGHAISCLNAVTNDINALFKKMIEHQNN